MQVVLVGWIGSGKTTLFNKITNSNQLARPGGHLTTNYVQQKISAYGNFQFNLVDSPGSFTVDHKAGSAAGIIVALTERPVSRIIITLKAASIDCMKKNFISVIKPVKNYLHLVTVAVTHMDQIQDLQFKQEVIQLFSKMNCNSIIFTSQNDSGNSICDNILQEIRNSRAEQLKFNPSDILQLFDLEEINEELEFQLEDLIFQLVLGLRKLMKPFREQLQNHSPQTPQGISILCNILVELKNKSREYLETFELKNNSFLISLEQQEKFTVHKRLIQCLEQELQNLFSDVKRKFQNNKQAEAEYLKVVGSENIDCSFEKNKEWKIQLQQSQELCLKQLQNKIEEQKKRIVTL